MKLQTAIQIYDELNTSVFGNLLERPTILATRAHVCGQFTECDRPYIEFNLKQARGLDCIRDTVYHEMIHQYLAHVMDSDSSAHDAVFWQHYYDFANGHDIKLGGAYYD